MAVNISNEIRLSRMEIDPENEILLHVEESERQLEERIKSNFFFRFLHRMVIYSISREKTEILPEYIKSATLDSQKSNSSPLWSTPAIRVCASRMLHLSRLSHLFDLQKRKRERERFHSLSTFPFQPKEILQNVLHHLEIDHQQDLMETLLPGFWNFFVLQKPEDDSWLIQQSHIDCLLWIVFQVSDFCKIKERDK